MSRLLLFTGAMLRVASGNCVLVMRASRASGFGLKVFIVISTSGGASELRIAFTVHLTLTSPTGWTCRPRHLRTAFSSKDTKQFSRTSPRCTTAVLPFCLGAPLGSSTSARGRVFLAVDCAAALRARFSCPSMPLFGVRLRSLATEIRSCGVELSFSWVPAHNRHPGWKSPHPEFSAEQLRSLNDAAERSAKACVARRLRGSLREKWFADAAQVKEWEATAVRASARAAERLSAHLDACAVRRTAVAEVS